MLALTQSGLLGWVTQSQSKYGATPSDMAGGFAGAGYGPNQAYGIYGYYWHMPTDARDNRGLGGGITWAWDDMLCKNESDPYFNNGKLEDQFMEDFFFAPFVTCQDMRAAMHRAFSTWSNMHPDINFVDVTEECRAMYGYARPHVETAFPAARKATPAGGGLALPWGC